MTKQKTSNETNTPARSSSLKKHGKTPSSSKKKKKKNMDEQKVKKGQHDSPGQLDLPLSGMPGLSRSAARKSSSRSHHSNHSATGQHDAVNLALGKEGDKHHKSPFYGQKNSEKKKKKKKPFAASGFGSARKLKYAMDSPQEQQEHQAAVGSSHHGKVIGYDLHGRRVFSESVDAALRGFDVQQGQESKQVASGNNKLTKRSSSSKKKKRKKRRGEDHGELVAQGFGFQ
eukprot:TRINITY_DN10732_c1_g1_i1.p2 TRINITY_DN10732_c1_g1~~TRINITY_DN10732_c1_g1_i1.p2  ORF type:complete len:229 (-),score=92.37 TRINITY_DN10732_c1_g1_i1:1097-1783(-)